MVDHEKGHTALHKAAAYKRRTICCMLGNKVKHTYVFKYTESCPHPPLAVMAVGSVWTGGSVRMPARCWGDLIFGNQTENDRYWQNNKVLHFAKCLKMY
jgi:hypothetical protein